MYRWTRDLHLYAGLLISPFLLLFAASVFFLNHGKVAPSEWRSVRTVQGLTVPDDLDRAVGHDAIARAKSVLAQLDLDGEVGFTRFNGQTRHFAFPVSRPGVEMAIDIDVGTKSATISTRPTSAWEAIAYLHKMPGPHNAAIRGNWMPTRLWRVLADTTVYVTLFLTITGIFLWWAIKAERRTGLGVLSAGLLTFLGLIGVLLH
jgi:hypothetical protein